MSGRKVLTINNDGTFSVEGAKIEEDYLVTSKTKRTILVDRPSFFNWPKNKAEIEAVTRADMEERDEPDALMGYFDRMVITAANAPFPIRPKSHGIRGLTAKSILEFLRLADARALFQASIDENNSEKLGVAMVMGMIGFVLLATATALILVISRV